MRPDHRSLAVTRFGTLHFRDPNLYWVEGRQRRYTPANNDCVVGIVTKKAGDAYKVDIGSWEAANLPLLSFEGATKKLKPDVQVGDAIYARLLHAHREMEPELTCVDAYGKAGTLGPLPANEGVLFNIGSDTAAKLLNIECSLLRTLGRKMCYEIALGCNGKVWLNAKKLKHIIAIRNVLESADACKASEFTKFVDSLEHAKHF